MDMIDRVAASLMDTATAPFFRAVWIDQTDEVKTHWRFMARAAIEAMQEPTNEMINFGQKIYTETSDVRDAYVAMVHTAYSRDIPY